MNPLFKEAADHVRLGWLMGAVTVLFVVAFLGWVWWAWSGHNREKLEQASRMPLNDGGES
jgi:cbb3-type cytochrome oxidase subunit 3